ncbi:CapA family protein [Micromonospora sp. ATA51]|nr:CapA family protein [Micromonospora sp. ATA51]
MTAQVPGDAGPHSTAAGAIPRSEQVRERRGGEDEPVAEVTLLLAGDVMTGRGVDQILPRPGPPGLREAAVTDARRYVELVESVAGPVPRPAPPQWPWGAALRLLDELRPDVRIVNLETAVTGRGEYAPGKGIHYRMHPDNLACLTAARLDVCALANNHVLDFGAEGLGDTLDALRRAGITPAGAGRDEDEAWQPARVPLAGGRRLLVWSVGAPSSGVPPPWARPAGDPAWRTCPRCPRPRRGCSPTGSAGRRGRRTWWWSPCTGGRTGATRCRTSTSGSRTGWWSPACTCCTVIRRTTRARSSGTGDGSSCTAAAT